MERPIKRLFQVFSVLLIIGLVGFIVLSYFTYSPNDENQVLITYPSVVEKDDYYRIISHGEAQANLVFYQGGLVQTESYLELAYAISQAGINVYIPKMPLNLAILDRNAFNDIYEDDGLDWYIGGHSLGGASAAYVAESHEKLSGIIFLAAYPPSSVDLSESTLDVLSITASEDEILDWQLYEESKALLPNDTDYAIIYGGNHSGFGSYGFQRGDGDAWISAQFQRIRTIELISRFMVSSD